MQPLKTEKLSSNSEINHQTKVLGLIATVACSSHPFTAPKLFIKKKIFLKDMVQKCTSTKYMPSVIPLHGLSASSGGWPSLALRHAQLTKLASSAKQPKKHEYMGILYTIYRSQKKDKLGWVKETPGSQQLVSKVRHLRCKLQQLPVAVNGLHTILSITDTTHFNIP